MKACDQISKWGIWRRLVQMQVWPNYGIVILDTHGRIDTSQKATIHQLTTMLSISENVLYPGHNHLLTTDTLIIVHITPFPCIYNPLLDNAAYSGKYSHGG